MTDTPPLKVDIPCPVCRSIDYRTMYPDTLGEKMPEFGYDFSPKHTNSYRVVRCASCEHVYCSPLPVNLYESYIDVRDEEYLRNRQQRVDTAKRVVTVIRRYKQGGQLLDVGCATGDFLDVANNYFQGEGLELSRWAADISTAKGLIIHRQRLSKFRVEGQYDVVTLWGVIEHFEDPSLEIGEIRRLLRPGGIVCLWTGDVDSVLPRVLGRRWWYFQGQHIQYFSKRSINRLFADKGFMLKEMHTYPYVMTLKSLAKSLSRYKVIGKLAKLLFDNSGIGEWRVTFKLPGEMLAIYEKV